MAKRCKSNEILYKGKCLKLLDDEVLDDFETDENIDEGIWQKEYDSGHFGFRKTSAADITDGLRGNVSENIDEVLVERDGEKIRVTISWSLQED